MHDPVKSPAYYAKGGLEVIKAINAWGLDADYCRASALTYIVRAGAKDPDNPEVFVQDLQKAIRFLEFRIERKREIDGVAKPVVDDGRLHSEWHPFPDIQPRKMGVYPVLREGLRAALCFWNGSAWWEVPTGKGDWILVEDVEEWSNMHTKHGERQWQ